MTTIYGFQGPENVEFLKNAPERVHFLDPVQANKKGIFSAIKKRIFACFNSKSLWQTGNLLCLYIAKTFILTL